MSTQLWIVAESRASVRKTVGKKLSVSDLENALVLRLGRARLLVANPGSMMQWRINKYKSSEVNRPS